MKLVLTKKEAVEKVKNHLKTTESSELFKLASFDTLFGRALESASGADVEKLVKDLGGVGRVFNVQGEIELSITA